MSLASETEDEVPVYNAKSLDLAFRFQYSEEDYASHLPFLNDLTPLEETKINNFLSYIDETELKFKRPPEEIEDIRQAVNEVVDSFAAHLENIDPLLAVSHKYAVGSMAEGTRIKEPDEFDFILVLKELTADMVSVESISKDDMYIECDNPECVMYLDHTHVPRPVIQKCTSEVTYQHVHLPLTSQAYTKRNKNFPGKWKRLGYACNWKNHFWFCLNRDSDGLFKILNLEVSKSTGIIKNVEQDISKMEMNAGPAMKLTLLWEPKTGNTLKISVDLVLAIERNGVENVIAMEEVPCKIYRKILQETDQFFLVPIQAADNDVCFKLTVTTTENKITCNLSKAHIRCYRILKYLFQGNGGDELNSYILKTFLLRHAALCNSQDNPAHCLTNILKILSIALEFCRHVHRDNEQVTVEHLFIPGLLSKSSSSISDDRGKYLMANAEQLFKVAKSEYNDQMKNLQGLKDEWKKIEDEISQCARMMWNAMITPLIHDIAASPGDPIDKLNQIARLTGELSYTSINSITTDPMEAIAKLHLIAILTNP